MKELCGLLNAYTCERLVIFFFFFTVISITSPSFLFPVQTVVQLGHSPVFQVEKG